MMDQKRLHGHWTMDMVRCLRGGLLCAVPRGIVQRKTNEAFSRKASLLPLLLRYREDLQIRRVIVDANKIG